MLPLRKQNQNYRKSLWTSIRIYLLEIHKTNLSMNLTLKHYQYISLVSGFLITFVFGALYTLGTITPYVASYIHYKNNPNIYAVDVSILYPTYMVSQIFGIVWAMNHLQRFIGFKLLCFIGVYGMALCVFITSFCESFGAYVFFYGVMFGFLVGFCYLIPTLNCYAYWPKKKGLCAGICMMAFGVGSLIFNFILLGLINPTNEQQDQKHLFPESVAMNVPRALRYMSLIYFSIGTVGCVLMIPKSSLKLKQQNEDKHYDSVITERLQPQQNSQSAPETQSAAKQVVVFKTSLFQLLRTKQYKILFLMILTSIPFGSFIAFNYKEYGQTLTHDDQLITIIGSLGAVSNSASRIFWCWLFDKYSFKTIMLVLNSSQILYCILIIFVKNPYIYIALVILIYFSYGANYGMYPTQTVRIYGDVDGGRIYTIAFSAFSIASVIQFLSHYFIVKKMGDQGFLLCFIVFGVLLIVAQILFITVNFKYKKGEQIVQQIIQEKKDSTGVATDYESPAQNAKQQNI